MHIGVKHTRHDVGGIELIVADDAGK